MSPVGLVVARYSSISGLLDVGPCVYSTASCSMSQQRDVMADSELRRLNWMLRRFLMVTQPGLQ